MRRITSALQHMCLSIFDLSNLLQLDIYKYIRTVCCPAWTELTTRTRYVSVSMHRCSESVCTCTCHSLSTARSDINHAVCRCIPNLAHWPHRHDPVLINIHLHCILLESNTVVGYGYENLTPGVGDTCQGLICTYSNPRVIYIFPSIPNTYWSVYKILFLTSNIFV